MFSHPLPTDEEVGWLYGHRYDYSWFIQRQGLKQFQATHRWQRLRTIFRQLPIADLPRRLLDVGGGHALFLRAAQKDGWKVEGLELLDDALVATAKDHGIAIHQGSLITHSLPPNTFGVVTAWHVVEHIPEIRQAIAAIAELLAPGGIGVIAVPNYHAAGLAREGADWVWCQKPFIHPWHLSATTLKALLPPSVEVLLLTSRDTWDAQWAESTTPFKLAMEMIYFVSRIPRKGAALLSWQGGRAACDRLQFWAEEGLRLVTYAGYLALRPLLRRRYEAALRGSELMLVMRKILVPKES
ncbi:MAG TPA: class I SAM-dependent methyltransferase [Chthoniobacter sp.]|nr:class I SAM-dependent methyltransferase [Chthoniobacter sp.]